MSGMYEMTPVRLSWRRTYVNFTDAMSDAMSAQRHIDKLHAPITVTYGTLETPDFQRQSRDFAAAVKAAGKPVRVIEAPNYHHLEMAESLGNPYGPNGRAALALYETCAGMMNDPPCLSWVKGRQNRAAPSPSAVPPVADEITTPQTSQLRANIGLMHRSEPRVRVSNLPHVQRLAIDAKIDGTDDRHDDVATIAPNATPMTTPTARSTTLPRKIS